MKNPLSYLTEIQQRDLKRLTLIVRRKIKDTVMVLFIDRNVTGGISEVGKSAVNSDGKPMLDNIEIVVIHRYGIRDRRKDLCRHINNRLLQVTESFDRSFMPLYLSVTINNLNPDTLFYWETCRHGIPLYDNGEIKLSQQKHYSPDYERIHNNVRKYVKANSRVAGELVWGAEQYYVKKSYAMTAFMLAQAADTYMRLMVYSHMEYDFKFKYPEEWLVCCCRFVPELVDIFPDRGGDDDRLYTFLDMAPRKVLYDPGFVVTKEDAELMLFKVWELGELSGKVCGNLLKSYKANISGGCPGK